MYMKRFLGAILCVCTAVSLSFPAGILSHAEEDAKVPADEPTSVQADDPAARTDGTGDRLILPSSYEQYLPLTSPADVSVTSGYIAVADENRIYVYDRAAGSYSLYEHTQNADAESNVVEEVQFAEDGTLYFRDVSLFLYRMDVSGEVLTAEKTDLACNSFEIYANTVYYNTTSQILYTTLDNLDPTAGVPIASGITSRPALALDNGVLYYTKGGQVLCRTDDPDFSRNLSNSQTVTSLAVYSGILYYTDTSETMYVYDLTAESVIASYEGGYTSLSVWDGYIYAADDNRIRRYSPAENAFTDYEIGASSDAENRLSGAQSLTYADGLLLTADVGNSRVSIYDEETGVSRTVSVPAGSSLLASDGKRMAAATPSSVSLYDLSAPGTPLYTFSEFQSDVVGAACVYGVYYFVTSNNYFYRLSEGEEGWTMTGAPKPSLSYTARLLASDIYGDLYVAFTDGSVFRFSESEFTDSSAVGEKVCSVPVLSECIAVDYAQTVYALSDNTLYVCEADGQKTYPLGKSLVWSQTADTPALSFAFGVEDGGIYVLYQGDFILRTSDVVLPTLRTIATEGSDEPIFGEDSAEFSVVQTAENALFVRFDLAPFEGAEYLPYLGYTRETEQKTALKLGETDLYNILAVFDESARDYSAVLVLKRYCTELPEEDYLLPAEGFEGGVGYLTSPVSLYKYPYLTDLLTIAALPKNAEVKVLGRADTPDYGYYRIAWTDENGEEKTGFIPLSYLTPFDGSPIPPESENYGGEGADTDSVWRLAFLLLGCASIGVLVDFLIIKRKDKDK